jgi:hypothetical protein
VEARFDVPEADWPAVHRGWVRQPAAVDQTSAETVPNPAALNLAVRNLAMAEVYSFPDQHRAVLPDRSGDESSSLRCRGSSLAAVSEILAAVRLSVVHCCRQADAEQLADFAR